MALDMTPEQKEVGKQNFVRVSKQVQEEAEKRAQQGQTRREFIKTAAAGALAVPVTVAAYFGSRSSANNKPVRTALIGCGDEGGVLVGEHNPACLEIVAVCDIRPSNRKRIFEDEQKTNPRSPRRGLKFHYGNDADNKIRIFKDYHDLLNDTSLGIEAVVIALPLHLHAPVAIDCLKAGKHVLCEKLMAWNIKQCKQMIGHQRHYSLLYAQALDTVRAGVLGEIRHIRALWHRNNTWPQVDDKGYPKEGSLRDGWKPEIKAEDRQALEAEITSKWDYRDMEELVRWRLWNRTGGGLMAELGSHQLDACSIFLGKVHPLAVSGYGGKIYYPLHYGKDREVDDHVFVTFEFPGPGYYEKDSDGHPTAKVANKHDVVVVTYSSISTNAFETYGECLMGTRGTMVVEEEQRVMLWGERDPNNKDGGPARSTAVAVVASGDKPVLDTSGSTGPALSGKPTVTGTTAESGPVSRGYREEMDHFAYCVRLHQKAEKDKDQKTMEDLRSGESAPRCHGKVAMADAIIALTSNLAMRAQKRIVFQPEWFDPASPEVPDDAEMTARHANGDPVEL
jgi:predicted dehydrogenase